MLAIHFPIRRIVASIFLVTGICGLQNLPAEDSAMSVVVADAVTYVSLAKVNLTVGEMIPNKGNLLGTYSINVPLMKSKTENGTIVMPMLKDLNEYAREGGTISGKGIAVGKEDEDRKINVRFAPYDAETKGGTVELTIDTGARILEFTSTYRLNGGVLVVMN